MTTEPRTVWRVQKFWHDSEGAEHPAGHEDFTTEADARACLATHPITPYHHLELRTRTVDPWHIVEVRPCANPNTTTEGNRP